MVPDGPSRRPADAADLSETRVYPDGVFGLEPRYDALEDEDGRTTIFDREEPAAWIRSGDAIALDDTSPMG